MALNLGLLLLVKADEANTNAPTAAAPPAAPAVAVETPPTPPSPAPQNEPAVDLSAPPSMPVEGAAPAAGEIIPSLEFHDADLLAVIELLAKQANLNFQFDNKILSGTVGPDGKPVPLPKVSFQYRNVTVQQALESLLDINDMIIVTNNKTKIARISYRQPGAPEPLRTKVFSLNFCNPSNMVSLIKPMFSDKRSQVLPDIRTSKIVVLATEKEIEEVHALIAELDTSTKQVLIESRIFETIQNPTSIKGIDWSGTLEAQNVRFGNGITDPSSVFNFTASASRAIQGGTTAAGTLPSDRVIPGAAGTTVTAASQAASDSAIKARVGYGGLSYNTMSGLTPSIGFLSADGVTAVISFLNKQADTELLATPRTVTLDNETATLEITKAYPIFQITPGSANSPAGAQIQYTNLGTILNVTPRISGNSNVTLKVIPEVSNIEAKDTQTINGQVQTGNIYAIRKMTTQVLIPSGGTLVMGGLMNDFKSKQYTKVPILGDLPVLGLAFRHENKSRQKQNLLVFVTPTIIGEADLPRYKSSSFLNTKPTETLGADESAWDSGKPYEKKSKGQEKDKNTPAPEQNP